MKLTKKVTALWIITGALCFAAVGCSGNGGNGEADKKHTYTYWMPQGEDASYYSDYKDNPVIQYLLTREYKGENGKNTKIDLEFQVPASGSARDNLTTMISTGDYADVMEMALYQGSIVDLYNQGIVQDITPYVEKYMPNYIKWLDAHPDLKKNATNMIDGKKKFIQLYNYNNSIQDQWCGYEYRRDWIVKYGKNPKDGSAFRGKYTVKKADGTFDVTSWEDNVVFPSGGSDPIYISDWEWMLDIFKTAVKEEGIKDGYPMSIDFGGYNQMGLFGSAFGGAIGHWYKDNNDKMQFGLTTDNFRTYLQVVNKWYKNGWIDTSFQEHSSDMFYKIDDAKVRQGKVGLWNGVVSELMGKIATKDGYAKDMVVYAARLPINDKYGSAAQKNVEPYFFYQMGLDGTQLIITDKASKKDMIALCSYLDYQFTTEGNLLKNFGLSKEQYELTKNDLYTKNGLVDGAYKVSDLKDGTKQIEYVDKLKKDVALKNASVNNRSFGLGGVPTGYKLVDSTETPIYRHLVDEWVAYKETGMAVSYLNKQLTAENANTIMKIENNIKEFAQKNIPNFVTGEKDPYNDADWNDYLKAIKKYGPDKATQIYQKQLDTLK